MPVVVGEAGPGAGMTLAELRNEVYERGFDDLDSEDGRPRVTRWINQAVREITDAASWPFLEETVSETAPLVVPYLGHVLSFASEGGEQLTYVPRSQIASWDPDFNDTGSASHWYKESEGTLKVYPEDPSTFTVRYLRVPEELSEDGDATLIPAAYQDLIVDGAVVRAYKNRDNFEAAQFVRQEWERGLVQMRHALLKPNYDNEPVIQRTGMAADYF